MCRKFDEGDRQRIFDRYWQMNWTQKKAFICSMMDAKLTGRRTTEHASRRSQSFLYNLMKGEQRMRVCKKMFLNTICMKQQTAIDWKNESVEGMAENPEHRRLHNQPRHQEIASHLKRQSVGQFLEQLPKVKLENNDYLT